MQVVLWIIAERTLTPIPRSYAGASSTMDNCGENTNSYSRGVTKAIQVSVVPRINCGENAITPLFVYLFICLLYDMSKTWYI